MDGTISVESTPGSGSTFLVILPFNTTAVLAKQNKAQKHQASLPLSLLLVEDEPVSQMIVQELLSDEGYTVKVASNGPEALKKVTKHTFDVILMDLRMPYMDGFETTQHIRLLPDKTIASTKIVAFTGDVMKETVQKCLDNGMDDVIAKPVDIAEINRVLSSLMLNPTKTQPKNLKK